MFNRSSQFSFKGKNTFNHVHGDQTIVKLKTRKVKRTEYDEFEYVKRGHVISVKDLGSTDWNWIWRNGELVGRHKAKKMFCTVEIVGRPSKYTAMIYEGEDAQTLWKEDFRQFSRTHDPQLFGINRSAIPALIFHHELIPCAHLYTGSLWMNVYLEYLRQNMGCSGHMIWMNTTSGTFFSGPEGPYTPLSYLNADKSIVVPSTVDMLKDVISFGFFSKFGSSVDNSVLMCASNSYKPTFLDDLFMAEDPQFKETDHFDSSSAMPKLPWYLNLWRNTSDHLPTDVIGGLRFDTVYSPSLEAVVRRPQGARSLWKRWRTEGLVDKMELDGGWTRFTLDPVRKERVYIDICHNWEREWLSQCLRVFDALGVTEGMQDFFVVHPPLLYLGSNQRSTISPTLHNAEYLIEETPPMSIYLFLHPLPTTISEFVSWIEGTPYFWSFDKTGQSRMSEDECERWGLPVLTLGLEFLALHSWPTHVYTALRDWQKSRGFDPTTSNWAQSMGYPELEIIDTEDRFVVVGDTPDEEWEVLDE